MAKSRKKVSGGESSAPEMAADTAAAQAAPQTAGDTTAAHVDRERIAARAYELYLARGGVDGQAMEDWLAAEREMSGVRRSGTREP